MRLIKRSYDAQLTNDEETGVEVLRRDSLSGNFERFLHCLVSSVSTHSIMFRQP